MGAKRAIHWFRQDLRLADNPALRAAVDFGDVLPIFILDDIGTEPYALGAASRCWLYHSIQSLNYSLDGQLRLFQGDAELIISRLVKEHNIAAVFWNRRYEPWRVDRDANIKNNLRQKSIRVESFNGSLLWEPWESLKSDGSPYRVFTPYFKNCRAVLDAPRKPMLAPAQLNLVDDTVSDIPLTDLRLLPKISWDTALIKNWRIGEDGANKQLSTFLLTGIDGYSTSRDFPNRDNLSRLSPHLHFGEISPNQVWHAVLASNDNEDAQRFMTQLGWREFSHSLLYYNPTLPTKCLQPKFDKFPWSENSGLLKPWQKGLTGYPIVDAGMRELWQTGYMHNRVRMIVASFLVKNLLIDWRKGEQWFWDCLFDADLANNSANWQWVAGCGADAAPYFRIFNPITQGEKFDRGGEYTRRYVPELKDLPDKYLFRPFDAPEDVLHAANIELGKDYPLPIVDLKTSRQRALDALASTKG